MPAPASRSRAAHRSGHEAHERLDEALRVALKIGAPSAAWQAHAALSLLHRRRGRRAEAERHTAAHARLIEEAAGSLAAEELRRRFLASSAEHEALPALRP